LFGIVDHAFRFDAEIDFMSADSACCGLRLLLSGPRTAADVQKNGRFALHGSSSFLSGGGGLRTGSGLQLRYSA
jgi:hypothetical protein